MLVKWQYQQHQLVMACEWVYVYVCIKMYECVHTFIYLHIIMMENLEIFMFALPLHLFIQYA